MATDEKRVKRSRIQRSLGTVLYRSVKSRAVHLCFPIRSNPLVMGMTREFPGVDIDAVHFKRK